MRKKIIQDLNIPESLMHEALSYAQIRVKRFPIPKKNGDTRMISQPSNKIKIIHYWLINNVFSHMPVHECATAYKKSCSIYDNAKKHVKNNYFLKIDLEDFFPSIKSTDLIRLVEEWHKKNIKGWSLDEEAKEIIKLSCFDKIGRLPIGYPTSPIISNLVMLEFDKKIISALSNKEKYGSVVYTRYADDLVFSTNKTRCCNEILETVSSEIIKSKKPNIKINKNKTKFSSKSGGSAFVTGLRICEKKHITIHRKYKDRIRLLLKLYEKGSLADEDHQKLKGHLNYVRHVDSGFFTKIQNKHFLTIGEIFSRNDI